MTRIFSIVLLFAAFTASAFDQVPRAATQSQVNAGVNNQTYVTPKTLAGSGSHGSLTNLNGSYGTALTRTSWPDLTLRPLNSSPLPELAIEFDGELGGLDEPLYTNSLIYFKNSGLSQTFNVVYLNNWWSSTLDASNQMQTDPAIFTHSMDYIANYTHTQGMQIALQMQPSQPTGGTFQSNVLRNAVNFIGKWQTKGVMFDMAAGFDTVDAGGSSMDYSRLEIERMASTLRLIAKTNMTDIHLSLSAYVGPPFQSWIPEIFNSFTLGPDGDSTFSTLSNHWQQMSGISPYLTRGMYYNANSLSAFSGNINLMRCGLAERAIGPATVRIASTNFTAAECASLTNTYFLALNQDRLVAPGKIIATNGNGGQIWARDLAGGAKGVVFYNPNSASLSNSFTVTLAQLGINQTKATAVDVWAKTNITWTTSFTRSIPSNTADVFVVWPQANVAPTTSLTPPIVFTNGPYPVTMNMQVELVVGAAAQSPKLTVSISGLTDASVAIDTGGSTAIHDITFYQNPSFEIPAGAVVNITDTSDAGAATGIDYIRFAEKR
jgi:hypothetical protein